MGGRGGVEDAPGLRYIIYQVLCMWRELYAPPPPLAKILKETLTSA